VPIIIEIHIATGAALPNQSICHDLCGAGLGWKKMEIENGEGINRIGEAAGVGQGGSFGGRA
jgi:hypothetical protein